MESQQGDIASQLLHSADARIAEAAKRVFSSTLNNDNVYVPAAAASLAALSSAPTNGASLAFGDSPSLGGNNDCVGSSTGLRPGEHAGNAASGTSEFPTLNDGVTDNQEGGDKKPSSTERLKRSRERNRMHARKTRQRKKEHMQKLQNRADELKLEQIRLKQAINEKNTASILVGLLQTTGGGDSSDAGVSVDPKVEMLLKRSTDDIPDASKIPELPALILPGQHNGKRKSTDDEGDAETFRNIQPEDQEDGIDYALLGKDRSSCSPAELDQIRRERNRMHAKRTRDRKRIFMEEMEVMIKELEEENLLLQGHLMKLNDNQPPVERASSPLLAQSVSPDIGPTSAPSLPAATAAESSDADVNQPSAKGDFLNQIESLLAAAGSFQKTSVECEINAISCAESDSTASTNDNHSYADVDNHGLHASQSNKRQRIVTSVPKSITTTMTSFNLE